MFNAASIEHVLNVSFPLAAVDAALKLACRDLKGLSHYRHDEIAGKLIVYRINQPDPPAGLGICGGIRLQYLTEQHTRLSIEVEACSDAQGVLFGQPPDGVSLLSPETVQSILIQGGKLRLVGLRRRFLTNLCNQTIHDLTIHQPCREGPARSLPAVQGGRPPLSQGECTLRMALGLLEEHLKQKDNDTKRGEVVLLAVEKLNIPAGIGDVKDGMERLRRAREKDDQGLLRSSQEQFQSWLPRLSP